jgi:hypothetical protein
VRPAPQRQPERARSFFPWVIRFGRSYAAADRAASRTTEVRSSTRTRRETAIAKGWSRAKVERAFLGRRLSPRPEIVAFRDSFARLVQELGSLRLLKHGFSVNIAWERLPVAATRFSRSMSI